MSIGILRGVAQYINKMLPQTSAEAPGDWNSGDVWSQLSGGATLACRSLIETSSKLELVWGLLPRLDEQQDLLRRAFVALQHLTADPRCFGWDVFEFCRGKVVPKTWEFLLWWCQFLRLTISQNCQNGTRSSTSGTRSCSLFCFETLFWIMAGGSLAIAQRKRRTPKAEL